MSYYMGFENKITFKTLSLPEKIVVEEWHESAESQSRKIAESIINLRDQCVRDALIKLGWTPPGDQS